jgi:ferritin-like metal-binding protein YciE
MGLFTKDIKTFEDLFLHGLKDMYYAENKIVRTLPVLIDNASDAELKRGLRQHLDETEHQIGRLEHAFRLFGQKPQGTKCYGIQGLISEGDELMGNVAGKNLLNAAVITSAQAVEHYEITRYGALIAWANEMGRNDIARILEESLAEEKAADQKLTKIAEGRVNRRAEGKRPLARARSAAARRSSAARRSRAGDRRRSSRK